MWRTVELQLQLESSMWKLWQLVASWQLGASQDQVVADWLTDWLSGCGRLGGPECDMGSAQLSAGFRFCSAMLRTDLDLSSCKQRSHKYCYALAGSGIALGQGTGGNCSNNCCNCAATVGAIESHWTMDPFVVFDLRAPLVNILFRSGHDWFFMFDHSNNSFISAKCFSHFSGDFLKYFRARTNAFKKWKTL